MESTKEKIFEVAPDENSLLEQLFSAIMKLTIDERRLLLAAWEDRENERKASAD